MSMNPFEAAAYANKLTPDQLKQAMRDEIVQGYIGWPILQQKIKDAKQAELAKAAGRPQAPTVASQVEAEADQHELMKRQALAMQEQMAGTGGISDMLRKPEAMAKGGAVAFSEGRRVYSNFEPESLYSYDYLDSGFPGFPNTPEYEELKRRQGLSGVLSKAASNIGEGISNKVTDIKDMLNAVPAEWERRKKRDLDYIGWYGTENNPNTPVQAPATPAATQTPVTPAQSAVASNIVGDLLGAPNVSPLSRYTPPVQPVADNTVGRAAPPAPAVTPAAAQVTPVQAADEGEARKSLADYQKEWRDLAGENKGITDLKSYLAKQGKDYAESKDKAPWMALLQAGLATMGGTSPYAMANIGAGAQTGLKSYAEDMKDLRKEQDKHIELQAKIAQAQREEDLAALKYGSDSVKFDKAEANKERLQKQQLESNERVHALDRAVTAAGYNRPTEAGMKQDYYNALIKAGKTPEEAYKTVLTTSAYSAAVGDPMAKANIASSDRMYKEYADYRENAMLMKQPFITFEQWIAQHPQASRMIQSQSSSIDPLVSKWLKQ